MLFFRSNQYDSAEKDGFYFLDFKNFKIVYLKLFQLFEFKNNPHQNKIKHKAVEKKIFLVVF